MSPVAVDEVERIASQVEAWDLDPDPPGDIASWISVRPELTRRMLAIDGLSPRPAGAALLLASWVLEHGLTAAASANGYPTEGGEIHAQGNDPRLLVLNGFALAVRAASMTGLGLWRSPDIPAPGLLMVPRTQMTQTLTSIDEDHLPPGAAIADLVRRVVEDDADDAHAAACAATALFLTGVAGLASPHPGTPHAGATLCVAGAKLAGL